MKTLQETIEDRLKRGSKLDPNTGCINWVGMRGGGIRRGYGQIRIPGKGQRGAHVVAWECVHGPRPEGYEIRHMCGNKLCVNVRHLVLCKASAVENNIEGQLDRLKKRMVVNPGTGCWEWQGSKVKGYGHLYAGKRNVSAHRLMWECVYGDTQGLQVLHKCDNRCCIRPNHLFLGTQAENMRDKVNKGRTACKLNADAVRDIRTSKLSPKELAEKYKVTIGHIHAVLRRETWKHIE